MDRFSFVEYWKNQGIEVEVFCDGKYSWVAIFLDSDYKYDKVVAQGYDDIEVIAKFDEDLNLSKVSYQSHVAFSTDLQKEFDELYHSKKLKVLEE